MKSYFIKERLFAIGSKFDVYDENRKEAYLIEADKFDIGKNIYIYDKDKKNRLLYLKQKIRLGAHKYIVYDKEMKEIAKIQKEFMTPIYNIHGEALNIVMEATSILGRHYEIKENGTLIGRIDKELTLGRDRYTLKVIDESKTVLMLGLLIVVDMVRFHSDN